ncbi:tRNA (guanine-N(7)-)-methyltransferase [Catenovulum sp. 2E275]|uniref:tRNA (guanine(46)-N(7))-methyltransferase TrmB n=1 Tax=Catenovulum sp. 2E275 TaxID=2980497 RepID=UPI0021CF13F8|nr:tRNA (guanine-N(7)-)-methyltransferase [Catenovulum sp. 2E275]MCU4674954.1 tRNA (guanine-N(7)-)-methyltransferase [Catenovulum sp. 2E275]
MSGNSRAIQSNQSGLHQDLDKIVKRHLNSTFLKPVSEHTQIAFEQVMEFTQSRDCPVILDACCGVGDSSRNLAELYPDHTIIGVDKSDDRITRQRTETADNIILVRADLNDFYRLLAAKVNAQQVKIEQHKIFYPNPWPKATHIKRRWHGAPVFPDLVSVCNHIELRSNWLIYLQEFQYALKLAGLNSKIESIQVKHPITPFEAKYNASGQTIYQLKTC